MQVCVSVDWCYQHIASCLQQARNSSLYYDMIQYRMIRGAILTCTQKLTFVSLIYHTELPRLLLLLLLQPFNGLFSRATWVGPFQKGKTSLVLAYPGCPGKEAVKRVCLQCRRLS